MSVGIVLVSVETIMQPNEDSLEVMLVYSDYLIDCNQQTESDFIKDLLNFPQPNLWHFHHKNTSIGGIDNVGGNYHAT